MEGIHDTARVTVVRADKRSVTALCTNHAFPQHPIEAQTVALSFDTVTDPTAVFIEPIDEDHANAKRSWIAMGSPIHPGVDQVRRPHAASELQADPLISRRVASMGMWPSNSIGGSCGGRDHVGVLSP